jgi:hypothetical protein
MTQLTAADIAGFFRDWAKQTNRTTNLPTEEQCKRIAKVFNGSEHQKISESFETLHDRESEAGEKIKDIELAAWTLLNKISEYASTMQLLGSSMRLTIPSKFEDSILDSMAFVEGKYEDWYARAHMIPLLQTDGIFRLGHAVDDFMRWRETPKPGKRANFPRNRIIYVAALECQRVLDEIRWREQRPSIDTDDGPVAFVVARCITKIEGKALSPAGAASTINTMKKHYERKKGIKSMTLPPSRLGK